MKKPKQQKQKQKRKRKPKTRRKEQFKEATPIKEEKKEVITKPNIPFNNSKPNDEIIVDEPEGNPFRRPEMEVMPMEPDMPMRMDPEIPDETGMDTYQKELERILRKMEEENF